MIITSCFAPRHGPAHAWDLHRCDCPEGVAERRAKWRRQYAVRYIPGRRANLCGGRTGLDEIAVERAAGGDRSLVLTVEERRAAIDRLDATGMTAAQVAIRLGVTVRTVQRQRERRRSATHSRQEVPAA